MMTVPIRDRDKIADVMHGICDRRGRVSVTLIYRPETTIDAPFADVDMARVPSASDQ